MTQVPPPASRVAVVTGAASGIGAATARRLAASGASVVVIDREAAGARRVAAELDGVAIPVDVTDTAAVRAAFVDVAATVGPVDVLVNNAGAGHIARFVDTDDADWQQVLAVNLVGTLACTHAVLPEMLARRHGVIVNVASEAGRVGTPGGAIYSAAKAGVIGFTKAIAKEVAGMGVRCNAVAPGPIDTPLLRGETSAAGALGARVREGMIAATALGRCGTPDEVAAAIAFLASDDASFVTGETIAVSGGISMW